MKRFIDELRRRGVVRTAVAYLATAWLLVQVLQTLFPVFGLPESGVRWVVLAAAIGFLPALALSWAFEWTPGGLKVDAGAAEYTAAPQAGSARHDRIIIAILAVAVAYFALDKFVLEQKTDPAGIDRPSIAVLPFIDLSPAKDHEYFADGMSEELLNLLARIPQLRVASRGEHRQPCLFFFANKEGVQADDQIGGRIVRRRRQRLLGFLQRLHPLLPLRR